MHTRPPSRSLLGLLLFACIALAPPAWAQSPPPAKIPPALLTTLTVGYNNGAATFDDNPATSWFPGWQPVAQYPARLEVDLGDTFHLTEVRILDGTGIPTLRFYAGTSATPFLTKDLTHYQKWWSLPIDVTAARVVVELVSQEGDKVVPEIEFWGTPAGTTPPGDTVVVDPPDPPVVVGAWSGDAAKLGMDGFPWIPVDKVKELALLREYQMTTWTWFAGDSVMFNPTSGPPGNYDAHYKALKDAGVRVIPCINKLPQHFAGTGNPEWSDLKMVDPGGDPTNPLHYKRIARYGFQVAARYGTTVHPASTLRVKKLPPFAGYPPNQPLSGLGLLSDIELENEPNRWWKPTEAQYTPEEFAAFCSAVYDGHQGALGPGYGIKTADPKMRVVMAGLANMNVAYLEAMRVWFTTHRTDKKFAADVVNLHHYANEGNQLGNLQAAFTVGIHPEADPSGANLDACVQWVRTKLPTTPVWYSEFGYDTNGNSVQRAPSYGNHSAEQVQAMWLVRAMLTGLRRGFDALMIYNGCDEPNPQGGLYTASGLLRNEAGGFTPKPSWAAVTQLAKDLNGLTFTADLSPSPAVRLYAFTGGGKVKFFVWSPTANGTTVPVKLMGQTVHAGESPIVISIN